jgi:hypothetical protein
MTGDMKWESLIPSLLSLYTSLNDDDEDIRTIAANTVSCILKTALAPPAASERFVFWLSERCNSLPLFIWHILYRITGSPSIARYQNLQQTSLVPAREQFTLALVDDAALFAEEEDNLYIDEVRDISLWSKLVQVIPPKAFIQKEVIQDGANKKLRKYPNLSIMLEFAIWVVDAIGVLTAARSPDGPLGWTSKPGTYEIVIRVLRCANVLLDYYSENSADLHSALPQEQEELHKKVQNVIDGLRMFCRQAAELDIHPQLIQELNQQKLLDHLSMSDSNKISLNWKNASPIGRSDIPKDQQPPFRQQ